MSEHECKYEGELPAFMATVQTTLGHIETKLDETIARQENIDHDQFDLLRTHGEAISATQREVEIITARMKNGGLPAYIKLPWRKIVLGLGLASSGGYAILTWASDVILFVRDNAVNLFLK